ncbi:MAG: FecR domain-containing protein [Verrucomicrobiota bacterium]
MLRWFVSGLSLLSFNLSMAGPLDKAKITRIINQVEVVESHTSRKARAQEIIQGDNSVTTGVKSRAELMFTDRTLTRLGSNTVFNFDQGTRNLNLKKGVMLLQVPKGLGGTKIKTASVSAAITGTTIMMEYQPNQHAKVLVLEGSLRMSIPGRMGETQILTPGKMLLMPAGAKTIPEPVDFDIKTLVKSSSLVTGMDEGEKDESNQDSLSPIEEQKEKKSAEKSEGLASNQDMGPETDETSQDQMKTERDSIESREARDNLDMNIIENEIIQQEELKANGELSDSGFAILGKGRDVVTLEEEDLELIDEYNETSENFAEDQKRDEKSKSEKRKELESNRLENEIGLDEKGNGEQDREGKSEKSGGPPSIDSPPDLISTPDPVLPSIIIPEGVIPDNTERVLDIIPGGLTLDSSVSISTNPSIEFSGGSYSGVVFDPQVDNIYTLVLQEPGPSPVDQFVNYLGPRPSGDLFESTAVFRTQSLNVTGDPQILLDGITGRVGIYSESYVNVGPSNYTFSPLNGIYFVSESNTTINTLAVFDNPSLDLSFYARGLGSDIDFFGHVMNARNLELSSGGDIDIWGAGSINLSGMGVALITAYNDVNVFGYLQAPTVDILAGGVAEIGAWGSNSYATNAFHVSANQIIGSGSYDLSALNSSSLIAGPGGISGITDFSIGSLSTGANLLGLTGLDTYGGGVYVDGNLSSDFVNSVGDVNVTGDITITFTGNSIISGGSIYANEINGTNIDVTASRIVYSGTGPAAGVIDELRVRDFYGSGTDLVANKIVKFDNGLHTFNVNSIEAQIVNGIDFAEIADAQLSGASLTLNSATSIEFGVTAGQIDNASFSGSTGTSTGFSGANSGFFNATATTGHIGMISAQVYAEGGASTDSSGGNGGIIDFRAPDYISIDAGSSLDVDGGGSGSGAGGNAGTIDLSATNGYITIDGNLVANGGGSGVGTEGSGGTIGIKADGATAAIATGSTSTISTIVGGSTTTTAGDGGTVLMEADQAITLAGDIIVGSDAGTDRALRGGLIDILSHRTAGTAIAIDNTSSLQALMSSTGGVSNGRINVVADGATGDVLINGANIAADVLRIGAVGSGGQLYINGGSTLSATSLMKLYSGTGIIFDGSVTLDGAGGKTAAAPTITLNNGANVIVNGGNLELYTDTANFTGSGGNSSTTGSFSGTGAISISGGYSSAPAF